MKRVFAFGLMAALACTLAAEPVGTTTGGPLTVSGIPIYGIGDDGHLNWYFHQGAHNGSVLWANGGNRITVGSGWNEGLMVFKGNPAGTHGVIYRVDSKGDLYWYEHLGHATGTDQWIQGKKVGGGWQDVRLAFGAGNGVVYAVHKNGDLLWYRHRGYRDGSFLWENGGVGKKVGVGWGEMRIVFGGGDGIIYAINRAGDFFWFHHEGHTNGAFQWSNNATGIKVGNGWNAAASVFSGGKGIVYALKRDGNLYWYNHTGYSTGVATWTPPGTGHKVGIGWAEMVRIF